MAQNKEENIAHVEKQDEENNYNELYPKPSAQLASLLKKYLISGAQLNLGYYVNLENKRLFPLLLKESVTLFQKHKCQGCKGSHQFVIAGGYAAYLANLTTKFSDIDIFIHCTSLLGGDTVTLSKCKIKTNRNVSTLTWKNCKTKPKVQFIQVTFDLEVPKEMQQTSTFRDLMAMYVMSKFDLPICRVSAIIPTTNATKIVKLIDASAFDIYKTPSSEERRLKYEQRKNKEVPVNTPSLQLTTVFNLMNMF